MLLLMFLFNVGGYYLVFLGLRYSTYVELSQRIDRQKYEWEDVYEFKVPLTLPYPLQEKGYVRSYGEFEYKGEHYILAEQKLENDTLFIKGIKNTKQKRLNKAFRDYAKISNDLIPSKERKGGNLISKMIKEYKGHNTLDIIRHDGWHQQIVHAACPLILYEEYIEDFLRPPDHLS